MSSWTKPTAEQVEKARAYLGRVGAQRYFFDKLQNPDWVEPLRKAGVFNDPPAADRDDERGTIAFPFWPQSAYLVRMASLVPEPVLKVARSIETNNMRINQDLIEIGLQVPAALAVAIAQRARDKEWVRSPYGSLMGVKLAKLVAHLAEGGEKNAAFRLAQALLQLPRGWRKPPPGTATEEQLELPPDYMNSNDLWLHREMMKVVLPALLGADEFEAFVFVARLLNTAATPRGTGSAARLDNYSTIWRRAIEPSDEDTSLTLENTLVDAVRDAASTILKDGKTQVDQLVELLESKRLIIFRRLALHLLSEARPAGRELTAARLLSRELFEEAACRHEYARLLGARFEELGEAEQREILGWIMAGPDLKKAGENYQRAHGVPATEEALEKHRRYWMRDRLTWLGEKLPERLAPILRSLVEELGEPEFANFAVHSKAFWGPVSPKSDEDLRAMSIADIVAFVLAWQAPENEWHSSWLGLSRSVQAAVTERASAFADAAALFKIRRPAYVDAVLQGLSGALTKKLKFAWEPVLDLCAWVIQQPRGEEPESTFDRGEMQSWEGTRLSVARLLYTALRADSVLPTEHREAVWVVLEELSTDIDPSPHREAQYGADFDPANVAINTVRGETLHAVVEYALWLRRGFEKNAPALLDKGFDAMPEVRRVLDAHLDLNFDPSLAVRSVYGQFLPWLLLLDPTWGRGAISLIFPASEQDRNFWHAAWQAYIAYSQPYNMVFEVTRQQYRTAIDRLGSPENRRDGHAESQLAAHLVSFLWRGRTSIDPDDLLWQFMECASPSGLARVFSFIGEVLKQSTEELPAELAKNLTTLWERRMERAKASSGSAAKQPELKHFSSWLASGKIDAAWSYRQLLELCTMDVSVGYDSAFLERLKIDAAVKPGEVIDAMSFLLLDGKSDWQYFAAEQQAMDVVKRVYDAPDGEASKKADNLINALGARGYFQYRTLRSGQAAAM